MSKLNSNDKNQLLILLPRMGYMWDASHFHIQEDSSCLILGNLSLFILASFAPFTFRLGI